MTGQVRLIRADQRTAGDPTPGMIREEAVATDGMWAGLLRTGPRVRSGWHHHGDYESAIYVLTGALRMEFGPDGSKTIDAGPGDFLYVAKEAIHRESNPIDQESTAIVVRSGRGQAVFNVDGPAEGVGVPK